MNITEKAKLEQKIRLLAFEEVEEKLLPFADMKENVLRVCAQRAQTGDSRQEKRKARLSNTRRVALATACLLVGICVLSVLAPVPVSTANGFLRQAQIWIGGLLQMKISQSPEEISEFSREKGPMPDGYLEYSNWSSLQELRVTYDVNFLEPTTLDDTWTLEKVKAQGDGEVRFFLFEYSFSSGDQYLLFRYGPMADEVNSSIFEEDVSEYTVPVGMFYFFTTGERQHAQIMLGGRLISISSNVGKDAFLKILDGLRTIN